MILLVTGVGAEDDAEAVRFLDGASITQEEGHKIYETNACRVFGIDGD